MRTAKLFLAALLCALVAGCSASTTNVGSVRLQLSNTDIELVQHRSDSRGCAELVVLQTYDRTGQLIDSQAGRARSLPCTIVEVGIEAGSRVGSAAIIAKGMVNAAKATRPDNVTIDNANTQSQGQGQEQAQKQGQAQGQLQGQISTNVNTNVNANSNSNKNYWKGGNVSGGGGEGGHGGGHGNNGRGNGDGDGTNPGTGHHHDNGDNN